jgi:hypothetical protein
MAGVGFWTEAGIFTFCHHVKTSFGRAQYQRTLSTWINWLDREANFHELLRLRMPEVVTPNEEKH